MIWSRHTLAEVEGIERCGIDVKLSLGDRNITREFAVTGFDDETKALTILVDEEGKPLNLGKSDQGPIPGEVIATYRDATPPFVVVSSPDIVLTFEEPSV